MTVTHTFAELEVSADTYDEIAEALRKADYDHAFMEDGTIDMHGIGLTKTRPTKRLEICDTDARFDPHYRAAEAKVYPPPNAPVAPSYATERKCKCPHPPVSNYTCWCHARMGNDFWFLPADSCLYEKPNRLRDVWRALWAAIKRRVS